MPNAEQRNPRIRNTLGVMICTMLIMAAVAVADPGTETGSKEKDMPSFAKLKAKADAGERLHVVFLGGSLTWGANASDQQVTSYRALVGKQLLDLFPKSQICCHDAAIGGTGSQLGAYRLERDVLAHKPDLVFLDFTANNDIRDAAPSKLASYESLVRRIVSEANCPLVIMIFPFEWDVKQGNTNGMVGRDATIKIAEAYNVPVGDAVVDIQKGLADKAYTSKELWPYDPIHPGDRGYEVFAETAMKALHQGLKSGAAMRLPATPLHGSAYAKVARVPLAKLFDPAPTGWYADTPNRVSAWQDSLMTRWLDSELVAGVKKGKKPKDAKETKVAKPVPLELVFRGGTVALFGEETVDGGKYRATIDGKAVRAPKGQKLFSMNSKRFDGSRQYFAVLAKDLDESVPHTLRIEPVLEDGEQLRLGCVCVAGAEKPSVYLPAATPAKP